jgi:glycosyltransferase involved in cell wall biosynthesis
VVELDGLRVCFVAGSLGQGGAERQMHYMLEALRASGSAVEVLSSTRGEAWEEPLREAGFAPVFVGQSEARPKRLARIVARLHERPADVVQSQQFFTNAYAAFAARLTRARDVGAMRSDGLSELASGRFQGRLNLRSPRVIAANSGSAIRNVAARGHSTEKFFLLPNVVDTQRFTPAPDRRPGPVRVVSVGRLVGFKRFDRLIEAVAAARTESEVEATIVGSGREREDLGPALLDQAGELGLLPGGLQLPGEMADMAPVYRDSDVYVLTSDYEGTPNVVLEAMACGLPVLSTAVGDVPALIEDGRTGFLVQPGDQAALDRTLGRLVADEGLRRQIGAAARDWVLEHRSPASLPGHLARLYNRALAR